MTSDYIVHAQMAYDLQDASEELAALMELLVPGEEIDETEFRSRFAHLYSHLNSAWNVRNLTRNDLEKADDEQLYKWTEFPKDIVPL